ncbi:hypothetical protein JW979_08430, partial [bacterium]|nr:hypothetical protein [candidate division CSSED10-310 bacterium]
MKGYFLRRLLAIIPTFFGITIIAFIVLNMAPGGPVEQMIRQIRFGSAGKSTSTAAGRAASTARDTGVNQEIIEALQKQYGFDKPVMINTRITDRKVGGIDAIGMVLFDLDPNRSIEMELNPRGTIILPYLVPALLHPKGSDYGLVDLVSKNGLNAIEKKRNVLLTIPILYYPLERQTARIQAGLTSSSDLLTLAMKSDAEERLSLLRTARAMEYMMADSGVLLDWGWRNPISIPFLDWIADMFGPEAVQSPAHLENWWMEYRTTLDDGIIRK